MQIKINKERVRAIAVARGFADQGVLAEAAGVTEATLSRFLNGVTFSPSTLEAVCGVLQVNPIDIMDTSDFPAPLLGASEPADLPIVGEAATV